MRVQLRTDFFKHMRLTLIDRIHILRKICIFGFRNICKSLKNWKLAAYRIYYRSLFVCFHSFIWIIARNYVCEHKSIFQPRFRIDVNLSHSLRKMHSVAQRTWRGIVICVLRRKVWERARLIIPYLESYLSLSLLSI